MKALLTAVSLCVLPLRRLGWLAVILSLGASPALAQVTLFPAGSVWRYLDDGSDPGAAWRHRLFNDSTWTNGPAQLGYGDGDEARLINGGPPGDRFITTYFRRAFNVASPAQFSGLWVQLLRDDGAVVFVNGVEVLRSNLPEGPIDSQTRAPVAIQPPEESAFFPGAFSPNLLVPGLNVIAVEVHQSDPGSSDLSFDLSLHGATNPVTPSVTLTAPATNLMVFPGANVFVAAAAGAPGSLVARVEFRVNGTLRFTDPVPPYQFLWANLPPGIHALTATAIEAGGSQATSPPVVVTVPLAPAVATLVPNGATWRFKDDGLDPGSGWMLPFFPDSDWGAGVGELGFGDSDDTLPRPERTRLQGGPATNRFVTTYFRHSFQLMESPAFGAVLLRVLRDDGVAVYLNGVEVFRDNLPPDPLLPDTLALGLAPDDGTNYLTFNIDPTRLQPGLNTLAAEVHQSSLTSSDLSFDLMLLGQPPSGPPPDIEFQPQCLTAFLGTNVGFFVVGINAATYQWLHNGVPIPDATNDTLTLTNVQPADTGLYSVLLSNPNGSILSEPGELQLELSETGFIANHLIGRDLLSLAPGGPGFWPAAPPGCQPPIFSMQMGGSYGFSTYGATTVPGETNHCGISGGHSKWCLFISPVTERVVIRTEGSAFDTVLAVYTWDGNNNHPLMPVACDNDSGPDGSSRVEFLAVAGTTYYIAVDGVGGATGYVRLQIGGLRLSPPMPGLNGSVQVQLEGRRTQTRTYRLRASTNAWAPSNAWFTVFTTNLGATQSDWFHTYRTNLSAGQPRLFFNGQESP